MRIAVEVDEIGADARLQAEQPVAGAAQLVSVASLRLCDRDVAGAAAAGGAAAGGAAAGGAAAGMTVATKVIIAGVIIGGATAGTAVALTRGEEEAQPMSR